MTKLLVAVGTILTITGEARAQHEEELAPRLEAYWTREVVAVQPRRHPKARRFELLAHAGVIPNDPFVVYVPLGLRAAFHVTEQVALELGFAYNLQADTDLRDYLEENDAQLRARVRDRQQLRAAGTVCWSPVYGKLAVAGAILHLDGHLLAGAGIVRIQAQPLVDLAAATRPDFHLGAGVRLFMGSRWLLRLELRQHVYLRPESGVGGGGGLGFPTEVSLGVGILLGGR